MVVWPAGNAYDSAVYGFIWTVVPFSAVFVIGARCVLQDFCKPKKKRAVCGDLACQEWWIWKQLQSTAESASASAPLVQWERLHKGHCYTFLWSGWMENTCSWICNPCIHCSELGDVFGLQQVMCLLIYVALHWLFATSLKFYPC